MFENGKNFSWSPIDMILAVYEVPLGGCHQSGWVRLIEIPSTKVLVEREFFGSQNCKMYWQSKGDYLALLLDQSSDRHPSVYINVAIFKIREADVPVELFGFERESMITAFAWEPKGHRFALIQSQQDPSINFFTIQVSPGRSSSLKLASLGGYAAKSLFWSPAGNVVLIVGLTPLGGLLTFYNIDQLQVLVTRNCMAKDILWDPTGRFVATRGPPFSRKESGLKIWSFDGELLYQIGAKNLSQFSWRPTPKSLANRQDKKRLNWKESGSDSEEDCIIL